MTVNNASEASEIVKGFLTQMGWSALTTPVEAKQADGIWVVDFQVGFKVMQFEVKASTGEIVRYSSL